MLDLAPHKLYNNIVCNDFGTQYALILTHSEVTEINKQKFLTELAKLLTFMYDEDRQTALEMYSELFDTASDEQTLLSFLVSPTRQAVIIARAYNARERKLQVNTQSRDDEYYDDEGTPDYVIAIERLAEEAYERGVAAPKVPADQFSLFTDGVHPTEGDAAVAPTAEAESAPIETEAVILSDDAAAEVAEAAESVTDAQIVADSTEVDDGDKGDEGDDVDEVDAFLSEFSIADGALDEAGEKPAEAAGTETESAPVPRPNAEKAKKSSSAPPARRNEAVMAEAVDITEKKPIVWLLILYVIAAVPVVAICVLILLIPTLFFLLMAVGAVVLGIMALSSAFGAFTIFADVMVVLGVALVTLALGLLFLWLFAWFVGGAIAGFINAIIKLGGKWCYKEVPAA